MLLENALYKVPSYDSGVLAEVHMGLPTYSFGHPQYHRLSGRTPGCAGQPKAVPVSREVGLEGPSSSGDLGFA